MEPSVGQSRRSIWHRLQEGLDADEFIMPPWLYEENRDIYDKIVGVAYLVRENVPGAQIDWVWESALDRVVKDKDITILSKQLVVRLRLPWNSVEYEWLASKSDLEAHRGDLRVIDVFVRAKDRHTNLVSLIDPLEFEENRDRFEEIETRYLVTWHTPPGEIEKLREIDPRYVHLTLGR